MQESLTVTQTFRSEGHLPEQDSTPTTKLQQASQLPKTSTFPNCTRFILDPNTDSLQVFREKSGSGGGAASSEMLVQATREALTIADSTEGEQNQGLIVLVL